MRSPESNLQRTPQHWASSVLPQRLIHYTTEAVVAAVSLCRRAQHLRFAVIPVMAGDNPSAIRSTLVYKMHDYSKE